MPTMHGTPNDLAKIAVWLVCEPFSLMIANILDLSTSEKSYGVKSVLTRIRGSEKAPIFAVSTPIILSITLRETSFKSAILSRI